MNLPGPKRKRLPLILVLVRLGVCLRICLFACFTACLGLSVHASMAHASADRGEIVTVAARGGEASLLARNDAMAAPAAHEAAAVPAPNAAVPVPVMNGPGPLRDQAIPVAVFWREIFPAMLLVLAFAVVLSLAYVQLRREVARRRAAELRLEAARDLADSASLAKASFFATMSHEIRTPLSGIIGMLDLLRRGAMDDDQRQMMAAVDTAANALLQILDDVLDFSKAEANRMSLESVPVDLRAMVHSVVMVIGEPARRRGVRTMLRVDPNVGSEVRGDPLRIRQILSNLMSNAAKFTHQGQVTLAVSVDRSGAGEQWLRFSVSDTGIGIPHAKLAQVMAPYRQADGATSRRYGGTGLGLSVCSRLAALMGGAITLNSMPGRGTTATFTCRFAVTAGPPAPAVALELDIDSIANRVDRPPRRHQVVAARAGAGARAHAGPGTLGQGTLGQGMPGQATPRPGLALAAPVRGGEPGAGADNAEAGAARSTGMALSAGVAPSAGAKSSTGAASFNDAVSSVNATSSAGAASSADATASAGVASSTGTMPSVGAASATGVAAGGVPRILVVDDHAINREVVRRQLVALGYACDVKEDAPSALAALRHGGYALLLTDCQMPPMNGGELARAWRDIEASRGAKQRMPIVAMTATAERALPAAAICEAIDACLYKPVKLDALREMLTEWVPAPVGLSGAAPASNASNSSDASNVSNVSGASGASSGPGGSGVAGGSNTEASGASSAPGSSATSGAGGAASAAGAAPLQGLDLDGLRAQFGDALAARRFALQSLQLLRDDLAQARGPLCAQFYGQVARWLHRSVGALSMLGHWPVVADCTQLEKAMEQAIAEPDKAADRAELLSRLAAVLRDFEDTLREIERELHTRTPA